MQENEILGFCKERNVLLDSFLSKIFLGLKNKESLKYFLEKIKKNLGKKFISKSLIENNKEKISIYVNEISLIQQEDSNFLKNSFNLEEKSLERKKEIYELSPPKVKILSSYNLEGKKLEVKDFITYFRNRYEDLKNHIQDKKGLDNLISIGKLSDEKQKFSIIGMVINKKISKNKNMILEVEDLTSKMKIIINCEKEELIKECEDIALDSVIGFSGFGNREIMFVNEIIFPDTLLNERKNSYVEEYALFIGDLHFGSKNFLEKDFLKFIDFLNDLENKTFEVGKIKYLVIVGDLVTGVGNYPDQEKDLKMLDLEQQFQKLAILFSKVRKDIQIIISPGNHDGVRLIEPQPLLDEKYAWPLYELSNITLVTNPCIINIGERGDFSGFDILLYHGFSFPYYANNIPKLMFEKTMNEPEKIMKYLLKNRHLAPTHGSNQYFPLEKDGLLIRKSPDIFVSGHTHKSGVSYYNNVLLISSSSWEGITPYQEKFGNEPDHCKVPVFNLKTRAIKILDFESEEDGIKTFKEEEK